MLFETNSTNDFSSIRAPLTKAWTSLGNAQEVLTKLLVEPSKGSSDEIIHNKKAVRKICTGDVVYYEGSWIPVTSLNDNTVALKTANKTLEAPLAECAKEIYIHVLVCTANAIFVHILPVSSNTILSKLTKKLIKKFSLKATEGKWYFAGKDQAETATIESIGIKAGDKISCVLVGYDMQTFRRFKELDNSRGWYMSHSSPDAITFIPSETINIFGFGMYYTKEGPGTYTITYQLLFDSVVKKEQTIIIAKPDELAQVRQVLFKENGEAIRVTTGTKITIAVTYPDYNDSSRLLVGHKGDEYNSLDGNKPGLFLVEENEKSENGTDVSAGQIPELYYSLNN